MRISDWSSDVCSADLDGIGDGHRELHPAHKWRSPIRCDLGHRGACEGGSADRGCRQWRRARRLEALCGDLAGAGVRRGDRRERLSRHRRTGALGSRAAAAGYCAASATGGALAETSTVLAAPGSRIEWVTPCERHVLSNDPPSCCLMMRRSEEHTSELQSLMRIS